VLAKAKAEAPVLAIAKAEALVLVKSYCGSSDCGWK